MKTEEKSNNLFYYFSLRNIFIFIQFTFLLSILYRLHRLIQSIYENENKTINLYEEIGETQIIFFVIIFAGISLYSLYSNMKRIIQIFDSSQRNFFWLWGKFLMIIIYLSLNFTFVYTFIYYNYSESIKFEKGAIGTEFSEQIFNFFYFSIGNFLGLEGQITPNSILFKTVHIIQSFTTFFIIAIVIGNFDNLKLTFLNKKNNSHKTNKEKH